VAGDDGSAGEIRRLPLPPDPELDPLALEDEEAERLLDGELGPDQAPAGYGEVAALVAAVVAVPSPAELAGREAALAELRAATHTPGAMASAGGGRRRRRRRVGLLVAVVVCGLSSTAIAAAATGTLPAPIAASARRILVTVDDATSLPAATPGRPPAPRPGDGVTSHGQGPPPAATTAGPGAVNHDPCPASKAHTGTDKTSQPHAVTSQPAVHAAGDTATSQCRTSRPDHTRGNGQQHHPPSDGQGHGQDTPPPPDPTSTPGQGRTGPPPTSRGGASPDTGRPTQPGPPKTSPPTNP
jgi:hypothetical protein